ncbi:MAG: Uma2 family endonuclease [Tepidiformaceae bacterium]
MTTVQAAPRPRRGPPLEFGDQLTAAEFDRRYECHPEIRKAELIEGAVSMPSPVSIDDHGTPTNLMRTWLGTYAATTPGVQAADDASVQLDGDNRVQPDCLLRRTEGGTSSVGEDEYLHGAPELVAEVAASSASIDLGPKMRAYRRNGVQEYIVWQIYENRLDWFSLEDGEYRPLPPDGRGVIHGRVFPGLRLALAPLLARDLAAVLKEQQRPSRARRKTQP